jgi:predicted nucleotidyltransferase
MEHKDFEIAEELKARLTQVVRLVDFRVFGSRARGDMDEYSDLDVFIEVESLDKETKRLISDIVWEVGFKHFVVISPLIYTRHEIEESPLKASPIVRNIATEGIKI